jgi:hypothetical protein
VTNNDSDKTLSELLSIIWFARDGGKGRR